MARRANSRAEKIWEFLDKTVTILTLARWVASSCAITFTITIAFNNVGFIENIIIRDTI
jgi:hypothetical protein